MEYFVIIGQSPNSPIMTTRFNFFELRNLLHNMSEALKEFSSELMLIENARKLLSDECKAFHIFEATREGIEEYLNEANRYGELVGLSALNEVEGYQRAIRRIVSHRLTAHQKTVMDRVSLPLASQDLRAEDAFKEYARALSEIRMLSINGLREYVENGDSFPE